MITRNRRIGITTALALNALVVAVVAVPSVYAQTYRCTNAESGTSYVASQRVPRDKCAVISKKDPYSAYKEQSDIEFSAKVQAEMRQAIHDQQQQDIERNREIERRSRAPTIVIGMTAAAAKASSWGSPQHIRRTTTASGTTELWVYENGNSLGFRNGRIESIHE
jgi:spore germination protein YaaH